MCRSTSSERALAATDDWVAVLPTPGGAAQVARLCARAQATGWQVAFAAPGLTILASGGRAWPLSSVPDALVIGTVYARDGAPGPVQPWSITPATVRAVLAGRGASLFQRGWGPYVAWFVDRAAGAVFALRDPAGALAAWRLRIDGVELLGSHARAFDALGVARPAVDWARLHARLVHGGRGALVGIDELAAGVAHRWVHGEPAGVVADRSPPALARLPPFRSPTEAARAVRAAVERSVDAAVRPHGRVLHRLSGGLDSAIVLAALARAPSAPSIVLLNRYDASADGDEREYARAGAEAVGFELIVRRRDPAAVSLAALRDAQPDVEPTFDLYALEHAAEERALCAALGASAVTTGIGGDGLFFRGPGWAALAETLLRRPWRAVRVAVDAARLDRGTVWSTLARALAHVRRRDAVPPRWAVLVPTAGPATAGAAGRRVHLASLPTEGWPVARDGGPPTLWPLQSTLVLEACLRTPLAYAIEGGVDRAAARRAFANRLPAAVRTRYAKSSLAHHVRAVVRRERTFVGERLRDGRLLAHGLIERRALEAALARLDHPAAGDWLELFRLTVAECWLDRWLAGPRRDVA